MVVPFFIAACVDRVPDSNAGHADNVVAAIDMGDFAGDARGEIGTQESADIADFIDSDAAAQWRILIDVIEHPAKVCDAGGGQSLDRAGRDSIDAGALRAEVERQGAPI